MIKSKDLVRRYRESIGRYTYKERDCIRSIWDIVRAHGGKAAGVGSNHFARYELENMRPLTHRNQLYDGCAVLKTKLPGERGYALPDTYKKHPDKIDYNHIGIGTDECEILDSTRTADGRDGPGVSTAPIGPNSWDIIAEFDHRDVDYSDRGTSNDTDDTAVMPVSEPVKPVYGKAVVRIDGGGNVFLRIKPKRSGIWLARVWDGTEVAIVDHAPGWYTVIHGNKRGYIAEEYVVPMDAESQASEAAVPFVRYTATVSGLNLAALEALLATYPNAVVAED